MAHYICPLYDITFPTCIVIFNFKLKPKQVQFETSFEFNPARAQPYQALDDLALSSQRNPLMQKKRGSNEGWPIFKVLTASVNKLVLLGEVETLM